MIERLTKDSQSSIEEFREKCRALESSLIKSTGEILEATLAAMNKNGLMIEKQNRKLIENESMQSDDKRTKRGTSEYTER